MESGPSKIMVRLIPPACREEVAGDLHEESADFWKFAHTLICVVSSRARRVADPVVLLMEGTALYTAFAVAAYWVDRPVLFDSTGFLRLAAPAVAMLVAILLSDVYHDPRHKYSPATALVFGAAFLLGTAELLLPHDLALWGSGFGALVLLPIRTAFPPVTTQRAAKIPADWLKLELPPLAGFSKTVTAAVLVVMLLLISIAVARH
jgi:hypothetical protein